MGVDEQGLYQKSRGRGRREGHATLRGSWAPWKPAAPGHTLQPALGGEARPAPRAGGEERRGPCWERPQAKFLEAGNEPPWRPLSAAGCLGVKAETASNPLVGSALNKPYCWGSLFRIRPVGLEPHLTLFELQTLQSTWVGEVGGTLP